MFPDRALGAHERQAEARPHLAELARSHALHIRNLARRANAQLRHFLIALAYDDPLIIAQRATGRVSELNAEQFQRGQQELSKRVVLKYTPQLRFKLDESIERGDRIMEILDKIELPPDDDEPEA